MNQTKFNTQPELSSVEIKFLPKLNSLLSETSNFCFLKAEVMPSMRVHHVPHDTWVCIEKESGKVFSAYCTCFAGYVILPIINYNSFSKPEYR